MKEAPCSCRVSTYWMEDFDSASISRMFSSPGIPKTCVTPSFSRHSTISSAVERDCSGMRTSLDGRLRRSLAALCREGAGSPAESSERIRLTLLPHAARWLRPAFAGVNACGEDGGHDSRRRYRQADQRARG